MSDHTLYLCYFGLREPLVQTQVLPYLREIKKVDGLKVSLLTFEPDFGEKWSAEEIEFEKQKLAGENIDWYALPYHKSPTVPATVYDIFSGAIFARKLIKEKGVNILHARVHVPALMGAIANKFSGKRAKLLFDIRGFFPEEYTDAGRWKKDGWLYHSVKKVEKWLFKYSDGFVVLTERAREILFPESRETGFDKLGRPVEVIPCCVDLKGFEKTDEDVRREIRDELNVSERFVIIYVGSFGGWYMTGEMFEFFETAKKLEPESFALILTPRDKEKVVDELKARGFSESDFFVGSVPPTDIPKYLSGADAALSFIEACYSKQASSPTKIAEYLASGLPLIINSGVGDLDELVETEKVGVVINDFNNESYVKALREVKNLKNENGFSDRCKNSAVKHFEIEQIGGNRYRSIYKNLIGNNSRKP